MVPLSHLAWSHGGAVHFQCLILSCNDTFGIKAVKVFPPGCITHILEGNQLESCTDLDKKADYQNQTRYR